MRATEGEARMANTHDLKKQMAELRKENARLVSLLEQKQTEIFTLNAEVIRLSRRLNLASSFVQNREREAKDV